MLQFNQMSGRPECSAEILTLVSCTRRSSEFEKRYCFDLLFEQKPGLTFTFQSLSEEDRKAWLHAMDGKEPTYQSTAGVSAKNEEYQMDEVGFAFIRKCIEILETRGLEEEGLYRVGGVGTKITKLISLGMDRKKTEKERFQFLNEEQYSDLMESKTVASALKHFLRNLNEPLMTYRFHNGFIAAASKFFFSLTFFFSIFNSCQIDCNFDVICGIGKIPAYFFFSFFKEKGFVFMTHF